MTEILAKVVSRALGFRALSARLKERINTARDRLLSDGRLISTDGFLQQSHP